MQKTMPTDNVVKIADATAGAAAVGFGISMAAAAEIVTIVAGAFAILAAMASAWFHIERAIALRHARILRNLDKIEAEVHAVSEELHKIDETLKHVND